MMNDSKGFVLEMAVNDFEKNIFMHLSRGEFEQLLANGQKLLNGSTANNYRQSTYDLLGNKTTIELHRLEAAGNDPS